MTHRRISGPGRSSTRRTANVHAKDRYTVVAVDTDGDDRDDVAYITKGKNRRESLRQVAHEVADEAAVNVADARTFRTKKAAQEQAARLAPTTIELIARRASRGQS